jgi:hypothetical protein
LGMYTAIPSFFPHFKSTVVGIIFLNGVEYCLRFPLDVGHCFKTWSLQFHFQFGKEIQLLSPIMILEIKVGSSLAFCHSSRHAALDHLSIVSEQTLQQCCACSNFLLRSPGKLHNIQTVSAS